MMVDSRGILGTYRKDLEEVKTAYKEKWLLCEITNAEGRQGGIPEAMEGADVVIALSKPGPGTIKPEWVERMNTDAILFACANPVPEIWPWEAKEAGAKIIATGRSDFPNQVNNSLGFPGIFRGTLDVRASTITDEMCFAAAQALADQIGDQLHEEQILPNMDDWEVFPREAAAVAMKAIEQGIAGIKMTYDQAFDNATRMIKRSREQTHVMMREGFIAEAPID
jgi:malate dehydrogenase (oxaloacetate-decarboxylating)